MASGVQNGTFGTSRTAAPPWRPVPRLVIRIGPAPHRPPTGWELRAPEVLPRRRATPGGRPRRSGCSRSRRGGGSPPAVSTFSSRARASRAISAETAKRLGSGGRAGDRPEVGEADLDRDGAAGQAVLPEAACRPARPSAGPPARRTSRSATSRGKVSSWPIDFVSRSGSTGRSSRPQASSWSWWPWARPRASTRLASGRAARSPMRLDAEPLQPGQGGRADAPEPADGVGVEEGQLAAGLDDEHPVGLGVVAGQLGQQLVGGDADGGGQAGLGPDPGPDGGADLGAGAEQPDGAGDVEEGLVEGDRLDERGEGARRSRARPGSWRRRASKRGGSTIGLGAEPPGPAHRHGRVHAEAAGLVGGGRHHSPRARCRRRGRACRPGPGSPAPRRRRRRRRGRRGGWSRAHARASVPFFRRAARGRPRTPHQVTRTSASTTIRDDIFERPSVRSRNSIGTSARTAAGALDLVGHLDLEAVAVGPHGGEVDPLEGPAVVGPVAGGGVAGDRARASSGRRGCRPGRSPAGATTSRGSSRPACSGCR